jgi:hypothetical protein
LTNNAPYSDNILMTAEIVKRYNGDIEIENQFMDLAESVR